MIRKCYTIDIDNHNLLFTEFEHYSLQYKMKQNLLIIPGFGESTDEFPYQFLSKKYKKKFNVIMHNPIWKYRTASDWLRGLQGIINSIDVPNTTVVSFSFGAYITLIASEIYPFHKVILCSVSPFFREQLSHLPKPAEVFLGKRRFADFSTHKIPKTIISPSVFLFGSADWSVGIDEAKRLAKVYKGTFEVVPNTYHELTDEYLKKIASYI